MTQVALIIWPLVALVFFRFLSFHGAVAAALIGGYLLLPHEGGWNLPMVPTIGKPLVAALTAAVLAMAFARAANVASQPGWMPRSPVIAALVVMLILSGFGTALTNSDPIVTGGPILPGLRPYDALSGAANMMIMILPFLIARKYFATGESHRTLLIVLAVAGLAYSLPALWEIRMSPQLSRMVYDYFPHDWQQHTRNGGFRPVVFLYHALTLGIFLACAAVAAFGLWRIDRSKHRKLWLLGGLWLLMTVALGKTFGALAIIVVILPVLLLLPLRMHILAAAAVATALTIYPVLRAGGLVPIDFVVETIRGVAPDRVGSLEFRLRMEDILLEKANQRPVFGWGGWGRGRVYDEDGRDMSVTDGQWIISFSNGGWVRYAAEYGILCFAVFALALRWRRYELDPPTAILSVVIAAHMIDMIPNPSMTNITFFLAGALAGRLELERTSAGVPTAQAAQAAHAAPRRAPGGGRAALPEPDPLPEGAPVRAARTAASFSRFAPKPGRNV